jgi:heme exporter protein B
MELIGSCFAVWKKELRHLWRARARGVATLTFAIATLLVFSFAGGLDKDTLRANAGGYFQVGLLLASTLALSESFRVETEHGALEMTLLLPVPPVALFVGKALGNFVLLVAVGLVMLPFAIVLFDAAPREGLGPMVITVIGAAAALAAPGTLHAALASRARARDVLLPLLLFPLVVPPAVASVQAMSLAIGGDAMDQLGSWLSIVGAFCVVHWLLGGLLFPFVVEE